MREDLRLLGRRDLNGCRPHFDRHFGVFVRKLQGVVEHLKIFIKRQRRAGQLLLLRVYEFTQPLRPI